MLIYCFFLVTNFDILGFIFLVCQHQWVFEACWRREVLQPRWPRSWTWRPWWFKRRFQWKCKQPCSSSSNSGSISLSNLGWEVRISRTLLDISLSVSFFIFVLQFWVLWFETKAGKQLLLGFPELEGFFSSLLCFKMYI